MDQRIDLAQAQGYLGVTLQVTALSRRHVSIPETPELCLEGVEGVFLVWPFLTVDGASGVLDAARKQAQQRLRPAEACSARPLPRLRRPPGLHVN